MPPGDTSRSVACSHFRMLPSTSRCSYAARNVSFALIGLNQAYSGPCPVHPDTRAPTGMVASHCTGCLNPGVAARSRRDSEEAR